MSAEGRETGGGTAKGTLDQTLAAELAEESRGTLRLTAPVPPQPFYQGEVKPNRYFFYEATRWEATGTPWRDPRNRDEGEMSAIATVSGGEFTDQDPPAEVLRKLIYLSGAPGGTEQQYQEFINSETASAFVQFIYNLVPFEPVTVSAVEEG